MTPAGTSNELDVQNGREENTHTHSILVYILQFTQAPTPGCLDGTIIDSRIIPVITVVMLGYDWWLCMMINISIHHSGRILPDNYC